MTTATGCGICGGWGCYRCEAAADVRRQLDVAQAELAAAHESNQALKSALATAAAGETGWKRKYEALVCASRGVGYE